MAKVKKIVDGVVVEVDDNAMVKVIENGVVVEKPMSEVNLQRQSEQPSPQKKNSVGSPSQGGLQGSQDGITVPSVGIEVPPAALPGLGGVERLKEGEWAPTVLKPEEEQQFRNFMTNDPNVVAWAEEFKNNYGEYPSLEEGGYDYRGAWKAGQTPTPVEVDGRTEYHWGSIGEMGKDLKSPDHPTRWKSDYMQTFGKDPDQEGVSEPVGKFMVGLKSGMKRVMSKVDNEAKEIASGEIIINGSPVSNNTAKKNAYDREFIKGLLEGRNSIEFNNADPYIESIYRSQIEAGGEYDEWKSLKAGLLTAEAGLRNMPVWMNDVLEEATGIDNILFTTVGSISPEARKMAASGEMRNRLKLSAEKVLKAAEAERESKFKIDDPSKGSEAQRDVIDLFNQGKYGEVGRYMLNTTIESGPVMLTSAGAALATGNPIAGAAFLVPMSASMNYAETGMDDSAYRKLAEEKGITDREAAENFIQSTRIAKANVSGLAEGVPEALMGKVITNSFKVFSGGVKQVVGEMAEKAGPEAAKRVAEETAKTTATEIVKNFAGATALGGLEEFTTTITNELTDVFLGTSNKTFPKIMRTAFNDWIVGMGSTGIIVGPGAGTALSAKGLQATKKLFDNAVTIDPSFMQDISEHIGTQVEAGRMSKSQAAAIEENLSKREKAVKAVPKDKVSDTETVDTVQKIQELEERKKGLLPVYQEPIQAEIDAKTEKLKEGIGKDKPRLDKEWGTNEGNEALSDAARRDFLYVIPMEEVDGKMQLKEKTSPKIVAEQSDRMRVSATMDSIIERGIKNGLSAEDIIGELADRGFRVGGARSNMRPKEYVQARIDGKEVPTLREIFGYDRLTDTGVVYETDTERRETPVNPAPSEVAPTETVEQAEEVVPAEVAVEEVQGDVEKGDYAVGGANNGNFSSAKISPKNNGTSDRTWFQLNRRPDNKYEANLLDQNRKRAVDTNINMFVDLYDGFQSSMPYNFVIERNPIYSKDSSGNYILEQRGVVSYGQKTSKPTPPTDAVQEQSTESVPVRQQPEARQGVREEDAQGQETPQEGEAVREEVVSEQTPAPKRKLNLGARLSNIAQKVQEEGVEGSLLKKTAMWNRMGKRMRRSPFGANLMSEMQQERKKYGYELRPGKTGRMTVVNPQGKEVRWKSDFMTKEEKARRAAERKDAKKYKASILNAKPISVEHYIAQALASGTRFNRAQLESLLGKDYDIPSWMWSEKGMSIQPDYIASLMRDAGYGMDQESEVDPKDIYDAIVFFADRNGRKKAFEYAEEIYNYPEDARQSMTEEEAREMQEYMEQKKEFFPDSKMAYDGISAIDQLTEEQAQALEDEILAQENYESSTKFIQDAERYAAETEAGVGQTETKNDVPRDDRKGEAERKAIAKRLRDKKIGGVSFVDPLFGAIGISKALYDGAIELAAKQVEKGTKIGTAIANAIKYIDERMAGKKWDKGLFGRHLNDQFKMMVNGKEVEVKRDLSEETLEVVNGWYSPLEKTIKDTKADSLTAKEWLDRVRSKEGEDMWTGLRGMLEAKNPKDRVSKRELLNYLKDNRVDVVEVVKEEETANKAFEGWSDQEVADHIVDEMGADPDDVENMGRAQMEAWATENADFDYEGQATGTTKFHQYQLEGEKTNYKEVLVTLPKTVRNWEKEYEIAKDKIESLVSLLSDARAIEDYLKRKSYYNLSGLSSAETNTKKVAEAAIKKIEYQGDGAAVTEFEEAIKNRNNKDERPDFRSSHFDEPNILVHLRMNTRKDADGNKVLFLEEVQSDWGQKGKREGFDAGKKLTEREKEFIQEWENANSKERGEIDAEDLVDKYDLDGKSELYDLLTSPKIPQAPFVTDTNSWVKLGVKVALKEAVAQGVDRIAWTTGEQQNERYDLSKQVNEIKVEAVEEVDGVYFVDIELSSGKTENIEVENGVIREGSYKGQSLEDVIGKEYAEKVLSTPRGETKRLRGADLRLGGKGMKGFYGSPKEGSKGILGSVMEAVTGQETGRTILRDDLKKAEGPFPFKEDLAKIFIENAGTILVGDEKVLIERYSDLVDYIKNNGAPQSMYFGGPATSTQPSISITPELRSAVEKGQPLFGTSNVELAKAIRDKKITGTLFVDPLFGGVALTKAVYNGALELAAKLVEQNTEAGKVIAAVMKYVDDAMKGAKFNRNAVEEGFKKRLWFVADNDLFNDLKEVAREYGQSLNGKTPSATGLFNYIKEQDDTFTASNRHVSDDVFKAVFGTAKPEKPAAPVTKPSEKATKEAVKEARAEERKKASEAAKEKAAKTKEKADTDKKKATDKATEAAKQKYVNIGYRIGEAFGKLAGEIRGKAEGRKEGVKEGGRLQKQFAEQVNEILQEAIAEAKRKSPGFTVTATQLAASAKKLLSVNFNSPLSIERAVEYVDKVLNNATYSNDLSTANKLKKANIKRLERNDYGIDDGSMRQALKLNAESLSVEELADYLNFLSDISRGPYNRKKHEATVQKYAEMYREQKLLAQQGRTEDEKEASEKRKEAMSQSASEAKQEAIDEFEFERTDMNTPVSEAYQKDYSFIKTITEAELESLSEGKLRELSNSIRNMREGIAYASGNTSEVIRELKARRMAESAKEITEGRAFKQLLRDVFMPFKVSFSGLMDRTSTDRKKKLASMMPMNRIDSMMKGFTDSKIYDTFIQPISTAYSSFTEKMNQIDKGYDRLYSKVGKSIIPWKREQQRQDEMVKLSLIAIQKEFESNVGNDEVSSVADYMEAIAEAARFNSDYAPFANRYLSIYESMLEPDGTFDYRKQEGALDDDTKTFYEYAEAINQANTDYVEVSAIRNKENVSLRQAYTPISVALIQYSNLSEIQNMANTFSSDENVKPTTQSGNIKKRTRGSKPLYLDFHANAKRATRSVLMDYHMREPLRSVSKAFNLIAKDSDMSPEARAFFSAIEANIAKAVRNTFVNEYYEPTGAKAIVELWNKRGYQMALASIPRAGVEFASNFTHAAMYKPKELAMGAMMLQEYKGNDEDLRSLAIFAESAQVSRMFEKSTSLMAEQGSGTRGSSTVYGRAIDRFSDSIMSAPDRAIARPLWLGSFSRTFEAASGEKLDISKMVNDPQYRLDNEAAIQRARNVADANLSQGFASLNPFEGVVASQVTKDDNIVETFDKYMTRFMRYEFQSAVDSLNGLVGKNELSKAEAARLLGATILRMSAYQFAMSYAVDGFYSLIEAVTGTGPEDEEEDDDELSQKIGSSVAGTIISLLVFRRLGNLAKVPIGYAIETLNSRFGEELGMRNGEYDPYKDSMVFSQIPGDADKGDMNLEKLAPKFMGPYGAVAQTGIRFKNLLFNAGDPFGGKIIKPSLKDPDAIDKAHREIAVRIAPELFMETIGLPVPRDVKNLILREVFKDYEEGTAQGRAVEGVMKAKQEASEKRGAALAPLQEKISKANPNKFIGKDDALRVVTTQGVTDFMKANPNAKGGLGKSPLADLVERHNMDVLKKRDEKLSKVLISMEGDGKSYKTAQVAAASYYDKISKTGVPKQHTELMKEAISNTYATDFMYFYNSQAIQSK